MENLISLMYKNYVKLRNWSANESGPSFVPRPITGEKCVEGVTLDNEKCRRTKGIKNCNFSSSQETGITS
jgi:hypothetical protein